MRETGPPVLPPPCEASSKNVPKRSPLPLLQSDSPPTLLHGTLPLPWDRCTFTGRSLRLHILHPALGRPGCRGGALTVKAQNPEVTKALLQELDTVLLEEIPRLPLNPTLSG